MQKNKKKQISIMQELNLAPAVVFPIKDYPYEVTSDFITLKRTLKVTLVFLFLFLMLGISSSPPKIKYITNTEKISLGFGATNLIEELALLIYA